MVGGCQPLSISSGRTPSGFLPTAKGKLRHQVREGDTVGGIMGMRMPELQTSAFISG